MKKIVIYILCIMCLFSCIGVKNNAKIMSVNGQVLSSVDMPTTAEVPTILDKISELIFGKSKPSGNMPTVYVGGMPIGLSLNSNGLIVVGISNVITQNGIECPAMEANINVGDVLISVDNEMLYNIEQLTSWTERSQGKPMQITLNRNNITVETVIKPSLEVGSNKFKLGLWTREPSSGVGTLTFVKKDKTFASLGHPILNPANGEIVKIKGGKSYNCQILGVKKGQSGNAGELHGQFVGEKPTGEIYSNTTYGVYGKFNEISQELVERELQVADLDEIRPGKAVILSTISNQTPVAYDIEIVKVSYQPTKSDKGLVIRVVDKRLLDTTGGIVQGMSGSPIIQNGKLIGAVTHVFVADPTKGYGLIAKWMLSE